MSDVSTPDWLKQAKPVEVAAANPAWMQGARPVPEPITDMSHVGEMLRANLAAHPAAPEKVTNFADALAAGWQTSVSGLVSRGEAPSKEISPDAPWYSRAGGNIAAMAGDFPFMVGGALLGAGAGAPTGPGAAITGMAGAFALPAGLRATLMDAYTKGDFQNFGDFWNRASGIMWETTKGWLTGAATSVAGGAAKAALPAVAGVPTAAELGAMVTVGSLLEGHAPAAQDFLDAAIVLGGVKAATYLPGKLRQIYAETGKTPAQVVADASKSPELKAELTAAVEKTGPDTNQIPKVYEPQAQAERARQIVPGTKAREVAQSPFADIPQAPGEPAKPTHVNYNYLNTSEDAAGALSRLSSIYEKEIQTQRRGTVAWEQTSAEAAKMLADNLGGTDAKLLMPRAPGTAAGAAEILARKQLTIGAAEDMALKARDFIAKGAAASPEDTVSFLASVERTAMIQQEFLGVRAEAGRALNILKSTARDAERVKLVQNVVEQYGKDPLKLAHMMAELDNPAAALKFARDAVKATTWEKTVEAWRAGLVSGPVTQAANVMGNTTFMVVRPVVDAVASAFGTLTGSKEHVTAMEPAARIFGNLQGSADGLKAAWHTLKTGDNVLDGKVEQYRGAIEGRTGQVVRAPFRVLAAADAMFRTLNERGEAYSLAVREATREGMNPLTREFRERVTSLSQNPTPKMQAAISDAGVRFTLNAELGEKGKAIQGTVKKLHLEWAVPFIRTPTNIAKELARMTPLAPFVKEWRDAIKAGGAARQQALAEVAVGTSAMGVVFMYALDGTITGYGDPDPSKRRIQMAAGWQPYSIKVGDTYYSYQRLQPVGTLIGLAADVAGVWDHLNEEDSDKIPKMLSVAFANAITNQTFLQGITNVVNALSDPTRFGPRFAQGFARSAIPNIIGQPTEMADPYMREVDSMADAIRSRVPGLRQDLFPKRDVFGAPIETTDRLLGISPVSVKADSTDKVRTEAARLNVGAGGTPKTVHVGRGTGKMGDVPLTPEQRDIFSTESGKVAHEVLSDIVNSQSWELMSDVAKRRVYSKVFERARAAGAVAALPADQRAGIIGEIVGKMETELAPR